MILKCKNCHSIKITLHYNIMRLLKTVLAIFGFLTIFTFSAISQSTNRILVDQSTLENSSGNDFWIASKIKTDFINDILNYSSIEVINSSDTDRIKALQKDSESSSYGETVVELGKRIQAGRYITIKTTRIGNTYTASFNVINITTGKSEYGYSMPEAYSEAEFISKAHGELAVQALKNAFNVKLTPAVEKLILGNGNLIINSNESVKEAKENLEAIKAEQARLTKELSNLNSAAMTSAQYEAQQARLKTQQALLKQQQLNAEQMVKRVQEDAERKAREEDAKKKRDSQTQNEIIAVTKDLEQKAAQIRSKNLKDMTASQRISIIEGEKQILVQSIAEIENNLINNQNRMNSEQKKELAELDRRFNDVNTDEYKIFHTKDGLLNDTGNQAYKDEYDSIIKKYNTLIAQNQAEVKNRTNTSQNALRQKIQSDIEELEKQTYSADSVSDNGLYFRVDEYDGDKSGWNYYYAFYFGGEQIIEDSEILTYKEITGTYPAKYAKRVESGEPGYTDYVNFKNYSSNVTKFDSYFRMNVPYIQATIKYTIKSEKYYEPSKYTIQLNSIEFINLDTGRTVASKNINKNIAYTFSPVTAVDYRTTSAKNTDEKAEAEQIRIQRKKEAEEKLQQQKEEERLKKEQQKLEEKLIKAERKAKIKSHSTFGNLFLFPGVLSFYNSMDGIGLSLGYTGTIGISRNLFAGVDLEVGKLVSENKASFKNQNTFDGSSSTDIDSSNLSELNSDYFEYLIALQIGENANLGRHARLLLTQEIGCIYNSFGLGVGTGFEFYYGTVGFSMNYTLDWTYAHGFLDRYSIVFETCF
ncbi:MAG: hypothetical protein MR420_02850 [Spirochaetia bacterium]|nr:hypothetical protein [Spirochaetia bacterium]